MGQNCLRSRDKYQTTQMDVLTEEELELPEKEEVEEPLDIDDEDEDDLPL